MQVSDFNHVGNRTYQCLLPIDEELCFQTDKNYLFVLPEMTVTSVVGEKSCDFLQGQLTCDMRRVNTTTMSPAAICNLKGRIMALPHVLNWHGYKIILSADLLQDTMKSLQKTAMLSRIGFEQNTSIAVFGLKGADHNDILPDFPLPTKPYEVTYNEQYCCYAMTHDLYIIIASQAPSKALIEKYTPTKQLRGSLGWHHLQLNNHHVAIYPETRGLFLPHRLGLHTTGYISFDKGCYKGQEIIARMHYRSTLKHHLQTFCINTAHPLTLGCKLLNAETNQDIGELIDYCPQGNHSFLIAASMLSNHPERIKIEGHHESMTLQE